MKRNCKVSLLAGLLIGLGSSTLMAAEENASAKWNELGGWSLTGDIRAGYVKYDYNNANDSEGFYATPRISINTPEAAGFSAKVTGGFATDFGINDKNKQSKNFVFNAADPKSFAIVQEAYLKYSNSGNEAKIGREEINTPMISNDDYYLAIPNSFEVAHYTNTMLDDIMFTVGYVQKMAGVWDSGAYDPIEAPKGGTDFYSISQASFVSGADKVAADDAGAAYLGLVFDNKTHKAQAWGYSFMELYNVLFAQYNFSDKAGSFAYDLGIQFIDFKETGALASNNFTTIDYNIASVKAAGVFDNGLDFTLAAMKFSDGEGQGSTVAAFGGYPFFAMGNIVHWFNAGSFQNAANYQIAAGFDLSKIGAEGLRVDLKHVYTDLDAQYSIASTGQGQDFQKTYDLAVSYAHNSGAYLNFQYQYADIDHEEDINGFRLIGGYKF
ncbi:hypothetical protein [Sulfurovum sp.]|uniref:hypothetical protein n=1 Tax=Sulfurovum sp. TaxID=1969726 RepID=UPI00356A02FB